jgi:hypothetical protein
LVITTTATSDRTKPKRLPARYARVVQLLRITPSWVTFGDWRAHSDIWPVVHWTPSLTMPPNQPSMMPWT